MSLLDQFPGQVHKMHLFMELVGRKDNVPDCAGVTDSDFHRGVVMLIYETVQKGVQELIRFSTAGEKGEKS